MSTRIAPPPPERPPMVEDWFVRKDAPFPSDPLARLVYYARLAPSSHNTQPWKFVCGRSEIDVFADMERWLKAADPQQRELHLSLGCAIEALRIAADYAGWGTRVRYFPIPHDTSLVARVIVSFAGPKRDGSAADLLRPILTRRTCHRPFDPARPVGAHERARLQNCVQAPGVRLAFVDGAEARQALAAVEARADTELFARPEYRAELAEWVGEGLLGKSWLIAKLGQLAVGHLPVSGAVTRQDAQRLASAPLVALLASAGDEALDQVRCGEAFMRIALLAEEIGLRVQPISQVLEVPDTRAEAARIFGVAGAAQHLFRAGYAPAEENERPRRPLGEILVRAA